MFTIPLKNSSGSLTLLENGLLEIKKTDMTILISKSSMNRVNINAEGRIVIYQSNAVYSTDYEFRVDKNHISKVYEIMNIYMGDHSDRDLADIYSRLNKLNERIDKIVNIDSEIQSSIEFMKDYRSSISMLSNQLIMMSDFNIENIQRIDEKFATVNKMINSIQADINTDNMSPIVYEDFEPPTNSEEDSVTPDVIEPAKVPVRPTTVYECLQNGMACLAIAVLLMYIIATMIISNNKISPVFSSVPDPVFSSVPDPVFSSVPDPVFSSVPDPVFSSVLDPVVLISNENDTLEAF